MRNQPKGRHAPRFPFPVAHRGGEHNPRVLFLNVHATKFLTQDGENYAVILAEPDGTISLQPIKLPANAIGFSKIYRPEKGAARVSCVPGKPEERGRYYRCEWRDYDSKLALVSAIEDAPCARVAEELAEAGEDRCPA